MPPMALDYDTRTGRPLTDGEDRIETLSDDQLEAELTIAAAEPTRRANRLDNVLVELARRGRTVRRHQNSTGP
jgi:hypothetical protein